MLASTGVSNKQKTMAKIKGHQAHAAIVQR
jgi:hypothetical protein